MSLQRDKDILSEGQLDLTHLLTDNRRWRCDTPALTQDVIYTNTHSVKTFSSKTLHCHYLFKLND